MLNGLQGSELDDSAAALVGPLEGPVEILGPPVDEFQARLDHALETLEVGQL